MSKKPREIVIGRNGKRWWKYSRYRFEEIPPTHEDYKEVLNIKPNLEKMDDVKK